MASLKLPEKQVLRLANVLDTEANENLYYDTLSKISEEITDYRKKQKLSGQDLAKQANITTSVMSRIESGNQNITLKTLCQVLTVMNKKLEIRGE